MVKLLPVILLCSCTFGINTMEYVDKAMPPDDAWIITSRFNYQIDNIGYWKSPKQFEEDGGGDCEDFCIYMMYLLGEDSGARMAFISNDTGTIHAIVFLNGRFIEPQCYGVYLDEYIIEDVDEWFSYKYVMAKATEFGTKSVQ